MKRMLLQRGVHSHVGQLPPSPTGTRVEFSLSNPISSPILLSGYCSAEFFDHTRFIVGYGLHASQSSALVLEVLRAALTSYGTPQEILTDNGSQTWRGKSVFSKELD